MRVAWIGLLALSALISACGQSSSGTLSVSCGGNTALVGAKYIDVIPDPVAKTTVLSFPDPVNDDKTATMPVDRRCRISQTTQ